MSLIRFKRIMKLMKIDLIKITVEFAGFITIVSIGSSCPKFSPAIFIPSPESHS